MRPPKAIKIGPFKFEVVYDSALAEEAVVGRMIFMPQKILLQPGQAADYERDTVIHESLHAIISAIGFSKWFPEDKEEEFVRTFSPSLLALLRDNPTLVRYLTEKV